MYYLYTEQKSFFVAHRFDMLWSHPWQYSIQAYFYCVQELSDTWLWLDGKWSFFLHQGVNALINLLDTVIEVLHL